MMNISKDKQCYIDACLPDTTPRDKGLAEDMSMGYIAKPIPLNVITITAQEAKSNYREQSLLRYIGKGQS